MFILIQHIYFLLIGQNILSHYFKLTRTQKKLIFLKAFKIKDLNNKTTKLVLQFYFQQS